MTSVESNTATKALCVVLGMIAPANKHEFYHYYSKGVS